MLKASARPPSLVRDYDWHYYGDPAFDLEDPEFIEALQRAQETLDYGSLPHRPGEVPTTFVLRHLTQDEVAYIRDAIRQHGISQATRDACRLGLRNVSDFQDETGRAVDIRRVPLAVGGKFDGVSPHHMQIIDAIHNGGLTEAIGQAVIGAVQLPGKS